MTEIEWGTLVTEVDVDTAVITTLRAWMPTYLAQVERERSLPNRTLARPRPESYVNALDDGEFLDHAVPAIIVTTAETREVEVGRDRTYMVGWRVIVSAVARGRTPEETRAVASMFGACVRRVMVQQQSLGGFAGQVDWVESSLQPVPTEDGRYLAVAMNDFTVYVDEVVRGAAGPFGDPPDDPDEPFDPLAAVEEVTMTVTPKEE